MGQHKDIYNTKAWKTVRAYVISRANGLCETCKANGKIRKGNDVHHKEWLNNTNKQHWNISYNPDNLIYLCNECHNDTHDRSIGLLKFISPPGD